LWHLYFKDVFDQSGFDVMIGNPPYIQLEKNGGALAKLYKNSNYEFLSNNNKGDIYCLFYEKGIQLLKPQGILCYITSNKWMRADYGKYLREIFINKVDPILLIDFAGQKIFESATVDTNVLLLSKQKNRQKTLACTIKDKVLNNLSVYVRQHAQLCSFDTIETWTILSPIEESIKRKIEAIGTPLKDWDINIYRGILTGFNEAFIIDGKKKDELIAQDPKSAEIIRPILRGRDIKRYGYNFADLWLINTHNGIKEKGIKPINVDEYPAIKRHLDQYYPELEKRADKGDTPYNLRNCAYMEEFFKQKIVWKIIGSNINFLIDKEGYFYNNAANILTSDSVKLEYLIAFLNSRLFEWYFKRIIFIEVEGGGVQMFNTVMERIPITILPEKEQLIIIQKVNCLTERLARGLTIEELNQDLDSMIYKCIGINQEEIKFIETQ